MILYGLVDGDPYTRKLTYRPRTCFLMTQLGGKVPERVDNIREDLRRVLEARDIDLIDANSRITGRDFLFKIWNMIVTVPLAVAIVHEEMRTKTLYNVFYEIGIAQTLGKETLVIKSEGADVPSDFVRTEYIAYDDRFEENVSKYMNEYFERADYFEKMSALMKEDPLLAIDYLRRAFLICGRTECREQAKDILDGLNLEGRARDSVEMMLAEF